MAIYAAISSGENSALETAITREFGQSFYKVAAGQYLISAKKTTTKAVADKLGILGGGLGKVILFRVLNYKGWHSKDIWEWLTSQNSLSADVDPESIDE